MPEDEKPEMQPLLRILMPSEGDMELLHQDGGAIVLDPVFYSKESMGPHIQVVEGSVVGEGDDAKFVVTKALSRYRLKLKSDGTITLRRAEQEG